MRLGLILAVVLGLLAAPDASHAQQAKVWRLGVILVAWSPSGDPPKAIPAGGCAISAMSRDRTSSLIGEAQREPTTRVTHLVSRGQRGRLRSKPHRRAKASNDGSSGPTVSWAFPVGAATP